MTNSSTTETNPSDAMSSGFFQPVRFQFESIEQWAQSHIGEYDCILFQPAQENVINATGLITTLRQRLQCPVKCFVQKEWQDFESSRFSKILVIGDIHFCSTARRYCKDKTLYLAPTSVTGLEGARYVPQYGFLNYPDTIIYDEQFVNALAVEQLYANIVTLFAVVLDSLWHHQSCVASRAFGWQCLSLLNDILPSWMKLESKAYCLSTLQKISMLATIAVSQKGPAIACCLLDTFKNSSNTFCPLAAGATLPALIESAKAEIVSNAFEREVLNKSQSIVKSMNISERFLQKHSIAYFTDLLSEVSEHRFISKSCLSKQSIKQSLDNTFKQQTSVHLPASCFDIQNTYVYSESEYQCMWGDYSTPMVTIICNSYNHEAFIERCFKGFFSQKTQYPFEVLVHDDASTDSSQSIILKWQKKYPKMIRSILREKNLKQAGIRPKKGIFEYCTGQYIARCEGDDYWVKTDKLEFQINFLENNPDFFSCYHNAIELFEDSRVFRKQFYNEDTIYFSALEQQKKIIHPYIHTLIFRNEKTFSQWPEERFRIPLGDVFLGSYIGLFGKAAYFGSYYGSVGSRNNNSTFTPLTEAHKNERRILSFYWLSQMYKRMNIPDVSNHFIEKCIKQVEAQK